MTTKRKISVRKVLQAVFTIVLTAGCLAAVLGASRHQQSEKLKNILLHVVNEEQYQFLDKEKLLKTVKQKNDLVASQTSLSSVNLKTIEQQIYKEPWVAEAQVYLDNQRNMHIYVTQHVPVVRIFFENGQSFYLNKTCKLLPPSDKFTYYTAVVTNVPWFNSDSMNLSARAKIVSLVNTIARDSFWNVQVEQVAMTPNMEFEIYPVLGTHKIIFGDTSAAKRKLENLLGFYKTVLNKIGWDKYQVLDARFDDQVVAAPALAWKMPPKGFISNMDWVKTIMGSEPKDTANTRLNLSLVNNYTANATSATTTVTTLPKATSLKPASDKKPAATAGTTTTPHAIAAPKKTTSPKTTKTPKPAVTNKTAVQEQPKQSTDKPKTTATQTTKQDKPKNNTTPEKKEDQKPKYILN